MRFNSRGTLVVYIFEDFFDDSGVFKTMDEYIFLFLTRLIDSERCWKRGRGREICKKFINPRNILPPTWNRWFSSIEEKTTRFWRRIRNETEDFTHCRITYFQFNLPSLASSHGAIERKTILLPGHREEEERRGGRRIAMQEGRGLSGRRGHEILPSPQIRGAVVHR